MLLGQRLQKNRISTFKKKKFNETVRLELHISSHIYIAIIIKKKSKTVSLIMHIFH